jgi:hypothetical protein
MEIFNTQEDTRVRNLVVAMSLLLGRPSTGKNEKRGLAIAPRKELLTENKRGQKYQGEAEAALAYLTLR